MKKITFLIVFLLMSVSSIHAQLYSLPSCSTLGAAIYGPMYSTTTANATSRYAIIYPSSQLTGISGQVVNGIFFNRSTAAGTMAGTPNFKIYVKEITDTDFGAGALDWATATVGTTLVYDSNPAPIVGDGVGWKLFPLSTNFTYSGSQNLAVFLEYTNSTASTSISWFYEYISPCVDTGNNNTTKYTYNTTGTLPTSLATSNFRRPFIGFDYLVSCNAPTSITASDITTTTASISWVPSTTAPSGGHEYYLSTTNTPPNTTDTPTGVIPTGSTLNLIDLTPNTQYYIWLRANCGVVDGVSALVAGTFRTACGDATEFIEVFEGLPTGTTSPMPPCWAKAGAGAVYPITGSVAPMSPTIRLYMTASGTTPTESYAIMPAVSNLQANTHRLRFKAYSISGTDRTLEIGYVTNPEDISTYVYLQDVNLPGTAAASAEEFIIYPGALPAGVKHLVFKNPGHPGGVNTLYIDDVIWQQSPSCLEVSNVTTTLITENSAQINWTNVGTETAWDIEYGAPGFTLGDGTMVSGVSTNPYVLTTLSSNTNYQYYIRASCSVSDQSAWMGPYNFKTLCETVTDYIMNFEGLPTGTGNLPDCWSRLGTSTTVNIATGSVAPMSPLNRLQMTITTTTTAYALMTPVSNLQANTHKLRFKAYCTTANKILQVGYFTNPTDASTFVSLASFDMPSTAASTALEFELIPTTIPAGVTQLAFGLVQGTAATIYIDDVIWEVNSLCDQPLDLNANSITSESANLTWTNGSFETLWDIEYGVQGFQLGTGTQVLGVNTNPYTLSGLDVATNYQYFVRAVCTGNVPSAWSGPFSFTTSCTDVSEYSTDLSGLATGTSAPMPSCWIKLGNGVVYPQTGSVAPMSPTIRLYMFANSAPIAPALPTEVFAVLPPFSNLQANTHRLKFKAYATLAGRFLEFGYFTDPTDINTFVPLDEVSLPGTVPANAEELILIPGALPAGVKHLALKNPGFPGGSTTAYLDDFVWEAIPSCFEPTDLFASQLTQTSASLSWTVSTSNETEWDIVYGAPGFVIADGTVVSGVSNPYTLNGLTENTAYQFYVRSSCSSSSKGIWVGPYNFRTLCSPVAEYVMNFEGLTTGVGNLPNCWSKAGTSTNVHILTGSVAPMSGPNRLYMNSTATTEAYAILPPFSNIQANSHRLKFKTYATTANKVLQVGYFTNTPDVSTFEAISDILLPSTAASTALEFVIVPNNVPAGVSQLVLRLVQTTTATIAYMDDFIWEPIPSCQEPSNLFASQLAQTSVSLSWTASASNETEWDIEYGASGFTLGAGTLLTGISTNPYTLGGLTENTLYQYYVRASCSTTDKSAWVGPYAFRTLCSPVAEYVMNFEGQTTGVGNLPNCWSRAGTSTNVYTTTGSVAPMSPGNRLYMNISATNEAYAILPPFSNIQANTHRLKFKAYSLTVNKVLQVGYFTNTPDVNTFVAIENIQLPATAATTALEFIVAPNNIPVGVSQLVLRPVPGTAYTVYLDDFIWEATPLVVPSCATNVVAVPDATCGNFATQISWTAAANADAYLISVGTTPGATNVLNNVNIGPVTSYSFLGNANTTYYYTITPFNSFAPAVGCLEQSFTTAVNPCLCVALPTSNDGDGITNVQVGTTNFPTGDVFYFDHSANVVNLQRGENANLQVSYNTGIYGYYTYVWVDYNDNLTFEPSELVFTGQASTTNPFTLDASFLVPLSVPLGQHRMRIGGVWSAQTPPNPCYTGSFGVYLDFMINVVPELSTDTFDSSNFKYYPNPITNILTISYTNSISEVVISNLLGQQISAVKPNVTQTDIDMSSLPNGTYLVKVTSENQTKTVKVIKQ